MLRKLLNSAIIGISLLAVLREPAYSANTSFINFESDPPGGIQNPFISVDESGIAFNFLDAEIGDFGIWMQKLAILGLKVMVKH
jgi:hypothetical protein